MREKIKKVRIQFDIFLLPGEMGVPTLVANHKKVSYDYQVHQHPILLSCKRHDGELRQIISLLSAFYHASDLLFFPPSAFFCQAVLCNCDKIRLCDTAAWFYHGKLSNMRWLLIQWFSIQLFFCFFLQGIFLCLIFLLQTHCRGNPKFNFHKYMIRALEDDFKRVVGIRQVISENAM